LTSAIRVNIDYESVLFKQQPSSTLNETFEFLAFFVEDRPLFTRKAYTPEYLRHVESITGKKPQILTSGEAENWWGRLENPELERKLNSKITCLEFLHQQGEHLEAQVIRRPSDLNISKLPKRLLIKAAAGMSGRGNKVINQDDLNVNELQKWLKLDPFTIEPLLDRRFDFSTYVFEGKEIVTYQNLVDKSFHYKGTIINRSNSSITGLSFYEKSSTEAWKNFNRIRDLVIDHYFAIGNGGNFCLDSFAYQAEDSLKIYSVCEVNFRRTMGSVAYRLAQKLTQKNLGLFLLAKPNKELIGFQNIMKKISTSSEIIYLSPGDTRFEVFFISGDTLECLRSSLQKLKELLPGCEFAVDV
jgi:hypothetical protein